MNSRDRELLADEFRRDGVNSLAEDIETGRLTRWAKAALRAISQARIEGEQTEREAVVRFLRKDEGRDADIVEIAETFASIIETGDHLIPVSDDRDE